MRDVVGGEFEGAEPSEGVRGIAARGFWIAGVVVRAARAADPWGASGAADTTPIVVSTKIELSYECAPVCTSTCAHRRVSRWRSGESDGSTQAEHGERVIECAE